jgi:hypothetical protein
MDIYDVTNQTMVEECKPFTPLLLAFKQSPIKGSPLRKQLTYSTTAQTPSGMKEFIIYIKAQGGNAVHGVIIKADRIQSQKTGIKVMTGQGTVVGHFLAPEYVGYIERDNVVGD